MLQFHLESLSEEWKEKASLFYFFPMSSALSGTRKDVNTVTWLPSVALVQSLNPPFFPPHIGAEPEPAKRESRLTCMRMLKTNQ